ncbi:hypothetical protein TTHERM_000263700 (macronuclear) [Tetrahymena thermophila SB210]|uniref:Uncharacterized protein n=1 Tax=Tetrahymena thermophila (strain SB210) TaxID=312017 RepID=W7XLD9_TETTS|nr:hypothetical protein TTHERM_000263700 [Tetrahymena thermophila SB210]EWS76119.1 hypothetical protein TTHERM_000263700 [Tetrahymena thermophila SB210]|eukprot:XP_012651359.1 hypothetical protein TTHERM_000263700 [Tetrahymena thermophila SB210]
MLTPKIIINLSLEYFLPIFFIEQRIFSNNKDILDIITRGEKSVVIALISSKKIFQKNQYLCSPQAYNLVSLLRQQGIFQVQTEKIYQLYKRFILFKLSQHIIVKNEIKQNKLPCSCNIYIALKPILKQGGSKTISYEQFIKLLLIQLQIQVLLQQEIINLFSLFVPCSQFF